MNKILIIAPHPDDETIGCGGTLLKHIKQGDKVYWLIITSMHIDDGWNIHDIKNREHEIKKVAKEFQFSEVIELNYPTTKLDSIPMSDIVFSISNIMKKIQPSTVYLPNPTDIHTDHQIVFKAGYSCTKSFRYPYVKKILIYETLSETDFASNVSDRPFSPNIFINIDNYVDKKTDIMKIYNNQIEKRPFPRSIDNIIALATLRGSSSNCNFAEGFQLVKSIE